MEGIVADVILRLFDEIIHLGLVFCGKFLGSISHLCIVLSGTLGKIAVFCLGCPGEIPVGGECGILEIMSRRFEFLTSGGVSRAHAGLGSFGHFTCRGSCYIKGFLGVSMAALKFFGD